MSQSTQNTNLASKLSPEMSRDQVSKAHGDNVLQKLASIGKKHDVNIWSMKQKQEGANK